MAQLAAAMLASDVETLLDWTHAATSVADQRHRKDVLERVLLAADPGVVSASQRERARQLGASEAACAESPLTMPPHAVWVPLVLEPDELGFLRSMRVSFDASAHDGFELDLDRSAARAVSDGLAVAASFLGRDAPQRGYALTTVHPDALALAGAMPRIGGPSLGAATFVSAVSLWSERPVRPGTAITGKLLGERVAEVGALETKLHAALAEHSSVRRIVVPYASLARARAVVGHARAVEVIGARTLRDLADAALEQKPRTSTALRHRVAELRRELEQGWAGFRWSNVREHAERVAVAVPARNVEAQVEVLTMLGAAHERLGNPVRAAQTLEQALAVTRTHDGKRWVPHAPQTRLHQQLALTHKRLCHFGEASQHAERGVSWAQRGRLRDELFKAYGCVGLVELARGRAKRAVQAFEQALALVHEHAPESCVRSHGYLIQALGHTGDHKRAAREHGVALEHLATLPHGVRRDNAEAWLAVSYGGALVRFEASERAIATLDTPRVQHAIEHEPLPGLLARRYLGIALIAQGREREGQALLAASPFAYGPSLEPSLRFAAYVNVLCEAWALLRRGHWDRDIEGRTRVALQRVPEPVHDELERARLAALHALPAAAQSPATTREALGALVWLCDRIA